MNLKTVITLFFLLTFTVIGFAQNQATTNAKKDAIK